MKAAIVGAAGFLGRALCKHLQAEGWNVLAYDAVAPETLPGGVKFVPLDIVGGSISLPRGIAAVYYLAQSPRISRVPPGGRAPLRRQRLRGDQNGASRRGRRRGYVLLRLDGQRLGRRCCRWTRLARSAATILTRQAKWPPRRPCGCLRHTCQPSPCGCLACLARANKRCSRRPCCEKVESGEPIVLEPAEGESGEPEGLAISFSYVAEYGRNTSANLPNSPISRRLRCPCLERRRARGGLDSPFCLEDRPDFGHRAEISSTMIFFF